MNPPAWLVLVAALTTAGAALAGSFAGSVLGGGVQLEGFFVAFYALTTASIFWCCWPVLTPQPIAGDQRPSQYGEAGL